MTKEELTRKLKEEFISEAELMLLLGKSKPTLWRWRSKCGLRFEKHGATVMYPVSALKEFLMRNDEPAQPKRKRREQRQPLAA